MIDMIRTFFASHWALYLLVYLLMLLFILRWVGIVFKYPAMPRTVEYAGVRIESDMTLKDARITTFQGLPIRGVKAAFIDMGIGLATTCSLELQATAVRIDGLPRFQVADPRTGAVKVVKRIEFADGSEFVWEAVYAK